MSLGLPLLLRDLLLSITQTLGFKKDIRTKVNTETLDNKKSEQRPPGNVVRVEKPVKGSQQEKCSEQRGHSGTLSSSCLNVWVKMSPKSVS